jgi:hypothetical protein
MLSQGVTNVSTGCDECFDEVKGVCNNSANRWFLKAQKDKMLTISHLHKSHKTRVFTAESRLADFHSILTLFQRMIMRHFYADSHEPRPHPALNQ